MVPKRLWALLTGGLLHLFTLAVPLGAFTLEPVIMELEPAGSGASGVFILNNPGESPMAVELSVLTRSQDTEGREVRNPAPAGLVTLFPSHLILEPGTRRSVRIKWNGPADISAEQAFRILAEQLPVDFDGAETRGNTGRISIMFRYLAALYVRPKSAAPQIQVVAALPQEVQGKSPGFWLKVANTGSRHRILTHLRLKLTSSSGAVQWLEGDVLQGLAEENLLAGSLRYFRIPGFLWPESESPRVEAVMDGP